MEIEDGLYDLAIAYWDLQKNNYDIEHNYLDLLAFDFTDPDLDSKIDEVIARCKEITVNEKPPPEPEVDSIFSSSIAPVPNNTAIAVIVRAIMSGGMDFEKKPAGWQAQSGNLVYEETFEKAGTVSIFIKDCQDQAAFVSSLSLFTIDVMVGVLGHLCFVYCNNRTSNPLSLSSTVSARQILRYKNIKSYGEKRWRLLEKINKEMERLGKICIKVSEGVNRKGPVNYQGHLVFLDSVKRDFNPYTKHYIPTSWKIKPGKWAVYAMSKEQDQFIGKLIQAAYAYDHRRQRGAESFGKKLMYALFTVPGGTHYLYRGVKKTIREYLQLIGEYREGDDLDRKICGRAIMRIGKAIDLLVEQGVIETDLSGNLSDYIADHRKSWSMGKLLLKTVKIKMSGED